MKLHDYEDTHSPCIDLSSGTSLHSKEISNRVVADYATAGQVIGIDIQHAFKRLDLSTIGTAHLPIPAQRIA